MELQIGSLNSGAIESYKSLSMTVKDLTMEQRLEKRNEMELLL